MTVLLHYIAIIGVVLHLQLVVFVDYASTVRRTPFYMRDQSHCTKLTYFWLIL